MVNARTLKPYESVFTFTSNKYNILLLILFYRLINFVKCMPEFLLFFFLHRLTDKYLKLIWYLFFFFFRIKNHEMCSSSSCTTSSADESDESVTDSTSSDSSCNYSLRRQKARAKFR